MQNHQLLFPTLSNLSGWRHFNGCFLRNSRSLNCQVCACIKAGAALLPCGFVTYKR